MINILSARASRPFSWGAVFAGVVVGAVASLAILALGAFITLLFGFSFSVTGIVGLVWLAISGIVGAFVAGNIAVNAQAPSKDGDVIYQAVNEAHALLTGGVTAALLVLFSTFFTISGIGAIVGGAANIASSVGGAVGGAISTGVESAAAAGEFDLSKLPNVQNQLAKVDGDKIAEILSKNNDSLNKEQIESVGKVVKNTLEKSADNIEQDIDQIKLTNIDDYLKTRYNAAKDALTGNEFVSQLESEGLSRQEAEEVQKYLLNQAQEIEKKAEQAVQKAKDALKEAEKAARSAARWAALSWLVSALLTFLATLAGARCAAGRLRKTA